MTMWLLESFAKHGVDLLLGSTVLLGMGALAMWMHSRPIHVQRMGEWTLLAVMGWLVLAVVPMPRFDWDLAARTHGRPISTELQTHLLARDAGGLRGDGLAEGVLDPDADESTAPLKTDDPADEAAAGQARFVGQELERILAGAPEVLADTAAQPALDAPQPVPVEDVPPTAVPGAVPGVVPATVTGRVLGADTGFDTGALAPRPASADAPLPWAKLGAAFFLCGSTLAAGYLLLGVFRLRRILRHATPAPAWVHQLLAADAGAAELPRVLVSDARCGPFCVGVFRPTIVLPEALVARRSSALRHVLLHEIAHARQGDGRGQTLVALALPALWFHPLYWWVRKRVRFAAELLADDQAAGVVPRGTYARELIGLAETGWPSSPSPLAAPTILRSPSEFSRRIEMLLTRTDRLSTQCSATRSRVQALAACGLMALATGFFGAPPAAAQNANEYEQLVQEKQALTEQMHQMQDMMQSLRAQMEETRASQFKERARADEQARSHDGRSAEYEALRRELETALATVDVQRNAADVARAEAETLRQFLAQQHADAGHSVEGAASVAARLAREAQQAAELARVESGFARAMGVGGGAGGAPSRSTTQGTLDQATLDMVTSAIELDGDIRMAELELARSEELFSKQMISDIELMQSRIAIETLERKSKLIRSLLVAEVQATDAEYSQLSDSDANRVRRSRLQARMQILADALDLPSSPAKRKSADKDVQGSTR